MPADLRAVFFPSTFPTAAAMQTAIGQAVMAIVREGASPEIRASEDLTAVYAGPRRRHGPGPAPASAPEAVGCAAGEDRRT
jgi:hypothetical protein